MALSTSAAARKDLNTGKADMQHRHFSTVASIIRDMQGSFSDADIEAIAEHFADGLRCTNDKFDRKRFLAACK